MSLVSLDAAGEILDCTPRHIRELIEAKELTAVDVALHATKDRGTTIGDDGRQYASRKQRLRVDAQSIQQFIARRTVNRSPVWRRRRRAPSDVIQFCCRTASGWRPAR